MKPPGGALVWTLLLWLGVWLPWVRALVLSEEEGRKGMGEGERERGKEESGKEKNKNREMGLF